VLRQRTDWVKAVDDVSFAIRRGETFGLVGESGCGKTTLGRSILRLETPQSGQVLFEGEDVLALSPARLKQVRRHMQAIFQDPHGSLDPRMTVRQIIAEGLVVQGTLGRTERDARILRLLDVVGLRREYLDRYPHEFSGGQRQRIGIARALAMEPELLIADEPVSALDVSVQAQVLAMLAEIRRRLGLTMLFITHDLRVAAQVCDRVAVMQRGAIVEQGPTAQVFSSPQHPYTRQLLDSIPGRGWTPPDLSEAA
jgi:ABC-type oligopeptide transport system ATPase subunit